LHFCQSQRRQPTRQQPLVKGSVHENVMFPPDDVRSSKRLKAGPDKSDRWRTSRVTEGVNLSSHARRLSAIGTSRRFSEDRPQPGNSSFDSCQTGVPEIVICSTGLPARAGDCQELEMAVLPNGTSASRGVGIGWKGRGFGPGGPKPGGLRAEFLHCLPLCVDGVAVRKQPAWRSHA
jgi:hypothetical protein